MLKFVLIWWLTFAGPPDHFLPSTPETTYNCVEYDVTNHEPSNRICYTSPFKKTLKKDVMMIETNRTTVRFAILRKFPITTRKDTDPYNGKGSHVGSLSFAVVIGRPDELYIIREETRNIGFKTYYWFQVIPIPQNERSTRPVNGRAIAVSTEVICK